MNRDIRSIALLAVLASGGPPAFADCKLLKLLELPVEMQGLQPTVAARLEGKELRLLVDTGADFNTISPELAKELKLRRMNTVNKYYVEGITGTSETRAVVAKDFEIGGQTFHNVTFMVSDSGADGLLAQNFLRLTDVEFDLLNGVIRFMRPEGCEDTPLAYWRGAQDLGVIDIERTSSDEPYILGKALINGYHARVLLDSGTEKSILTQEAAAGAGVWPTTPDVIPGGFIGGVGGGSVPTWIGTFKDLKLDTETIRNTKLRFGQVNLARVDMLLGADFFLSHRLYVSYRQNKLYFTYNGGPVFNLTVDPNQRVTSSSADLSQPLPASGNSSQDAAQHARRARAFLARNQFDLASVEFERAMQFAPTDPEYAYEAGKAHVFDQHPQEALVDLDAAIKLKPDFVDARIQRGGLLLHRRELDRGRADLDAAISYSKDDSLALQIALVYVSVGQFRTAVEMLSAWIGKNPKHKLTPAAFSNRCYARAAEGEQLDLALSDCEAALAGMPMNYIVLTRRGLVYLRRGQTNRALSDFNAALKQDPSYAIALYGKGIVEWHGGRTKEADADFKAAVESSSEVSETFAVMGLTPPMH